MRAESKEYLSMVVLGHVDAGKSTLVGHLLYLTDAVSKQYLQKLTSQAQDWEKGTFKYAWIINKTREQRNRGITIRVYYNKLETKKHTFNIVNVPGHRDFIKNTINGIVQADVALLVVACNPGQFQAGISQGQTFEHALLAYTFGIRQIVVCISKLDSRDVDYDENRYNEVKEILAKQLRKIGFSPTQTIFVPISAWAGDNLIQKSKKTPWYEGPTVLQAIDSLQTPRRFSQKPLRMTVSQTYKINGVGTVVSGRVLTGSLPIGKEAIFSHSQLKSLAATVEQNYSSETEGKTGHVVGVNFKKISRVDIKRGQIIGLPEDRPRVAESFTAQIIILEHPGEIKVGYTPVVFCHSAMVSCRITEIQSKLDRRTGKMIEQNPKVLKTGDAAMVVMQPLKPLCVEVFAQYPPLGRFAMRDSKMTVGVGVIKHVVKVQQ